MADQIPFSPLTLGELLDRRDDAYQMAGMRCANVVTHQDGVFDDLDLDILRERGEKAVALSAAIAARMGRAS